MVSPNCYFLDEKKLFALFNSIMYNQCITDEITKADCDDDLQNDN